MLFRNVDATIEKGRWSSVKTARINLKESIAVFNSLSVPAQQLAFFDQLGHAMLALLFGKAFPELQRTEQLTCARCLSRIATERKRSDLNPSYLPSQVGSLASFGSRCVTSPCHANAWPRLRFGSRDPG